MLEVKNLYKKFGDKFAVDNLSFKINQGEIFGLLGKNGAGKTTTIKMLTLQSQPSSGDIFYNDQSVFNNQIEVKQLIGVVPQHINFDQDLNVYENLELHARLHHIDKSTRKLKISELLHYVELDDVSNFNVKKLSGGMQRRLLIIRALIHQPKILFLDEPTVALDPQVRRRIWQLISDLKSNGVTIILTTHYIEEAEHLCDRVAFLNHGKLIALDFPQNFCADFNKPSLEDVFIELIGDKI